MGKSGANVRIAPNEIMIFADGQALVRLQEHMCKPLIVRTAVRDVRANRHILL